MVRKQNSWLKYAAARDAQRRKHADAVLQRIEALQCSLREAATEAELLMATIERDPPSGQEAAEPPLTSLRQILAMDA